MSYQDLLTSFLHSLSTENNLAIILFGISVFIVLILIIYVLLKKLRTGETLKYEFITIIAHKFRTPLTHIKWSSDELVKNEADPYKKQSLIDIQQSNEKLIKLTNTLVELTDAAGSAVSTYAFERVSLCDFVRDVSAGYRDTFHEKNIFFSVQCPDAQLFVKVDKQRIEFVIQTLLENALAYTPPGKGVEVHVLRSGRRNMVSIVDKGIGIDRVDMPHIFTKFFRAKNAQAMDTEGFGVGLFLARTVTERHKGTLTAHSDGFDTGSTFTLSLRRVR